MCRPSRWIPQDTRGISSLPECKEKTDLSCSSCYKCCVPLLLFQWTGSIARSGPWWTQGGTWRPHRRVPHWENKKRYKLTYAGRWGCTSIVWVWLSYRLLSFQAIFQFKYEYTFHGKFDAFVLKCGIAISSIEIDSVMGKPSNTQWSCPTLHILSGRLLFCFVSEKVPLDHAFDPFSFPINSG